MFCSSLLARLLALLKKVGTLTGHVSRVLQSVDTVFLSEPPAVWSSAMRRDTVCDGHEQQQTWPLCIDVSTWLCVLSVWGHSALGVAPHNSAVSLYNAHNHGLALESKAYSISTPPLPTLQCRRHNRVSGSGTRTIDLELRDHCHDKDTLTPASLHVSWWCWNSDVRYFVWNPVQYIIFSNFAKSFSLHSAQQSPPPVPLLCRHHPVHCPLWN